MILAVLILAADPRPVPTPADAVGYALADVQSVPPADRPYTRYLMTTDRSRAFHGAVSYALNTSLSHASTLYRPTPVADGWLVRVDLRRLWPRAGDFEALLPEWEQLQAIDPYFHITSTAVFEEPVKVKVSPYKADDGRTYDWEWQTKRKEITGTGPALHLAGLDGSLAKLVELSNLTGSDAPVLRADWLVYIALTANEQEDGRYYRFRGIKGSDQKTGKSAEQLWLEQLGVDYATVQKIRSDQRIGKWRSNVTGKPRVIEYFYSSSARPIVGPSLTAMTRDFFDGSIDPRRHPIKNLLDYAHDGTEAMGVLPNGMIAWALFDGAGGLVQVAPQNLVTDRTVPTPHTANLQPPISCIRCHGADDDMWRPASNDVLALARGQDGLNFFDDESSPDDPFGTIDRLAGLYAGEMDEPLRIARNAHARATFICTAGMQVGEVAAKLAAVYRAYRYDAVTPRIACRELGWECDDEEQAAELFRALVPRLPANRAGIRPENPVVGTLRAWRKKRPLHVNRDDWAQEYADTALRALTARVKE